MENFQRKILELIESGAVQKSDFVNFEVMHDDWCDRLNGVGPCNCDPCVQPFPAQDVNDFVTTYMALRNSYRKH